ncbi:MAG TPA: putative metal-dependent hydrolase [Micromonosporaceae bacterium]
MSELSRDELEHLKYPTGRFQWLGEATDADRRAWIEAIAALPGELRSAVKDLTDAQLDTSYRPGGWTVRQVVHHVADAHLGAFFRIKVVLTQTDPLVPGGFDPATFAATPDAGTAPVEPSLALLTGLHQRWTLLLRSLAPEDFARTYRRPERPPATLDRLVALYAWHGRHHTAQITTLRQRMGW